MSKQLFTTKETNVEDLMTEIKNGKYIIPIYQREFVWSGEKIIDLLKSISNGYPIGVITDVQITNNSLLASGRNEIFESLSKSTKNMEKAVVDGQQRLTSLSIAYFATEMKEAIKEFRTAKQKTAVKKAINDIHLYKDSFYTKNEIEKLFVTKEIHSKTDEYCISNPEINEIVRNTINEYNIPIIRLETKNDKEVINVFTAMNKGGKPLTHVELMNGSMFNISNDFDLIKFINDTNKEIDQFGKIKPELFVQLMKIYYDISQYVPVDYKKDKLIDFSMKEPDVKKFLRNESEFVNILIEAIGILKTDFGFYSMDLLPKNVYLSVAVAYCTLKVYGNNVDSSLLKETMARISYRLIDGVYASSPGARTLEDINEFMIPKANNTDINEKAQIIMDKIQDVEKISEELSYKLSELTYKNKGQALSKLMISVLCKNNPLYVLENKNVPVVASTGIKLNNDLHHFIPSKSDMAKEYRLMNPAADFNIDKLANIAVITSDENRNKIRAKNINEYLRESLKILGEEKFERMLISHYYEKETIYKLMNWEIQDNDQGKLQDLITTILDNRIEKVTDEIMSIFFNK